MLHVGTLVPRLFDARDAELLQAAADRAAAAIERARMLHQRGVVEVLQRSLVPETLPTVPGLEFGGAVPSGRAARWDRRRLVRRVHGRAGEIALVVGDVMGHGMARRR